MNTSPEKANSVNVTQMQMESLESSNTQANIRLVAGSFL